jgi:hypothetical protein
MLKMSELFGHGNVDELVERNAFLLREVLRYPAHGGHEPEGKLAHGDFLLTHRHKLYLLFRTLLNSSAGVNTSR